MNVPPKIRREAEISTVVNSIQHGPRCPSQDIKAKRRHKILKRKKEYPYRLEKK